MSSHPPRPVRPWIAAVLSLVAPPAGFVYAGRARSALAIAVAVVLLATVVALLVTTVPGGPFNVLLAFLLIAASWIAIPLLAFRQARHAGPARPSRSRLAVRLFVVIAGWFVLMELGRAVALSHVEAFRAPSAAMVPTLLPGDHFLVRKDAAISLLGHGKLVAFDRNGSRYINRIVGLPGDTLLMRGGVLHRNGVLVYETYLAEPPEIVTEDPSTLAAASTWGPTVVPPDHLFVLGDNRHASYDSRYWGFLPASSVFGVPTRVYFSRDHITGEIRWTRMGRRVENRRPNTALQQTGELL